MSVLLEKVYSDGSGAPAVVTVGGATFACDFLGDVRCRLVSHRKPPRWAPVAARRAYLDELGKRASADWFEKNRAMYKGGLVG